MNYKWMGAVLVVAGCGGFGFSIAASHRRKAKLLRQLIRALGYMECELQYRLTPLPELCRLTAKEVTGILRDVFLNLARELDWQISPDAGSCMSAAVRKSPDLPVNLKEHLLNLGHTLGKFDLEGQLQGLQAVRSACEEDLKLLDMDGENRLRSYQTLGLCAGTALAILFL